jgi:hypothetical protein
MQIIRRGLGVVRRLPHVQQIAVDVVLHDELGRVEPVPSSARQSPPVEAGMLPHQ